MDIGALIKRYRAMVLVTMLLALNSKMCLADHAVASELIISMAAKFETVKDYTCKLDKRVRKNGILYEDLAISVKYKKPKHYYFRWEHGISKGREVIFVAGKHNDKLVAHPGGIMQFLTFYLDPEGKLAMQRNRHSLQHSGMEKIMFLIRSNYQLARKKGLDPILSIRDDYLDGTEVWTVECRFPEKEGYYAHRVIISIDKALNLPFRVSIYDWSGDLVEEYVFRDLAIDVGLEENDFEPGNPEYNFSSLKQ